MNMKGFRIATDDLLKPTTKEEYKVEEVRDLETSHNGKKYNLEELSDQKDVIGITIQLLPEYGHIEQLWMPVTVDGKYQFENLEDIKLQESIYFQVENSEWYVCCKKPLFLYDLGGNPCYKVKLYNRSLVSLGNTEQNYKLYVETVTEKGLKYHNYQFRFGTEIKIGRSESNDIIYNNDFVSRNQASIYWEDNVLKIKDCNSANGLWINKGKVKDVVLNPGDVISVFGLKIIVGVGFLSINDENCGVKIEGTKLHKISSGISTGLQQIMENTDSTNELFNRLPRRMLPMESNEIVIDAPPMPMNSNNIPLLLRMGSSMVMGTSSMLMGNYTMMLSSVLFPVLNSKYSDKQKKEYEERRVEKYSEYLVKKEKEIQEQKLLEEKILNYNYPELNTALGFVEDGKRLWERRKIDEDFLNIRIGVGSTPMQAKFNYPKERFSLDEDILENKMYELANKKVFLQNVPIMNSFADDTVCGITGTKKLTLSLVNRIFMQLICTHSYDEVKTVFLVSRKDLQEINYIRYIPHVWDNQKTFRFLATNTADAFQISEYLKKELEEDFERTRPLNEILKKRPYYLVFALDKKIFDSMEVLKDIMQLDKNCGVSVVTAFDDLPKECSKIFQLNTNGENAVVHLRKIDQQDVDFKMDKYDQQLAVKSMKQLANTNLKVVSQAYSLPDKITFLEMFGVGKIEHLNPLQRWKDSYPMKSLSAPVGVGTDGTLFDLDLHEKHHGPHGLIAGMTGSGKSEFIITYILSMAINYHPDEVSFLLIDYKGGGLTKAFEDEERGIHLPHIVGTITNLDGASIQRALVSIQSENVRRQRIFNEAKSKTGESSINIYDYQALYRAGKVDEALPHLFIIADEFAELKKQEPEFMDKLISTARIGRSLGVHLVLATQKPAGIVNDQILSNTKFRVCLKVQDKHDSMDMLKRPEGAEIKETGRFYLQVGYNDYFALGQSAWSGAQYEPQDEVIVRKDNNICFLDSLGQQMHEIKKVTKSKSKKKSQLTEIVQYLSDLAEREGIKSKRLWKEPLKKNINIDTLYQDCDVIGYRLPIGKIDKPKEQRQDNLFIDLEEYKNTLIIGEAASGKTTFLKTLLYSVSSKFLPDECQYYLFEANGDSLRRFSKLPHCGGVVDMDDSESLKGILELLKEILDERKKLFKGSEETEAKNIVIKQKCPLIIVVIDGFGTINSKKDGYELAAEIAQLMRDGMNYKIRFIITANHSNECNSKIRQESERRLALRAKDRFAYGEILGVRCGFEIVDTPGRGICAEENECYEFQTATVDEQTLKGFVENRSKELEKYATARRIAQVNETISYAEFMNSFKKERIPLGYDLRNGNSISIPLQQLFCMSLYIGNVDGLHHIVNNFINAAIRENGEVRFIRKQEGSCVNRKEVIVEGSDNVKVYDSSLEGLNLLKNSIIQDIQNRNPVREESCEKHRIEDWQNPEAIKIWRKEMRECTQPVFIVFESFKEFCENIDGELSGMFSTFFELCRGYNIYFISLFYPGDDIKLNDIAYKEYKEDTESEEKKRSNYIFKVIESYNKEKFGMLYGGQFHLQRSFSLPKEWREVTNPCSSENLNKALMSYTGKIYSLLMPCGEMQKQIKNEDDDLIIM